LAAKSIPSTSLVTGAHKCAPTTVETKATHEKTILQRQIDATVKQIDQLVYELYGLTEEEINIVESSQGQIGVSRFLAVFPCNVEHNSYINIHNNHYVMR